MAYEPTTNTADAVGKTRGLDGRRRPHAGMIPRPAANDRQGDSGSPVRGRAQGEDEREVRSAVTTRRNVNGGNLGKRAAGRTRGVRRMFACRSASEGHVDPC